MAERRNGAGAGLRSLLERPAQPDALDGPEPSAQPEPEPGAGSIGIGKGRGDAHGKKPRAALDAEAKARAARKKEARTIYIPDELYERIIVRARRSRPRKTISEYVVMVLDRNVSSPWVKGAESTETDTA